MNQITLVYPYYENPNMLKEHIKVWKTYNNENIKIIIIDDCSSRNPANENITDNTLNLRLFRIETPIPWNQHGAKNLGMKHVDGWALLLDMDLLLETSQLEYLTSASLDKSVYYQSLRRHPKNLNLTFHPNSFLIHSEMYWSIGGYDESFAGYYGSDAAFKKRLEKLHGQPKPSPMILSSYNSLIEDSKTTDFGRKGTKYSVQNNFALRLRRKLAPPPKKPINFVWHEVKL